MEKMMPVHGWEAAVIGHAERIRHELALADGEESRGYDELFEACSRALASFHGRVQAEMIESTVPDKLSTIP